MDAFSSAFSGLPGFSPMMTINTSGLCATTRLVQCRGFGVYTNDISRKFEKHPSEVPDISEPDFLARKKVWKQVTQWDENRTAKTDGGDEWVPILYLYEIVRASGKRERDWGHLVFSDLTTTRFLLVMVFPSACDCGNYSHHDYGALTEYQANRFMSLASYLYHDENHPKWVRATYTTATHNFQLDPAFLDGIAAIHKGPIEKRENGRLYPIFNITGESFVPSLLESELERIDNLTSQTSWFKKPPAELRQKVLGDKSVRPDVSSTWKQKNQRQCANCEKPPEDAPLSLCSGCKLVYYCGRQCQVEAWRYHKNFCKGAAAARQGKPSS